MTNIAYLDWRLEVECPACKEDVDLVEIDSDNHAISGCIFTNRWDELNGYEVECPHCGCEFKLDGVEY